MKRILLTCAAGLAFASFAEAGPISGIVKDKKTGEPLIGSVVQVKGSNTQMTTTGLDGTFSLKDLPDNGRVTLVITYMSYKTKEVTVDMSTPSQLTIDMEEDAKQLGEVVVTGFKSNRTDRSDEPAGHTALTRCQCGQCAAKGVGRDHGEQRVGRSYLCHTPWYGQALQLHPGERHEDTQSGR